MSFSVLVSDKSIPYAISVAASLRATGASVALLSPGDAPVSPSTRDASGPDEAGLLELRWKRSSPLSARTALLDVSNGLSGPDAAVVAFDATAISAAVSSAESPSVLIDSLVSGYVHLVREICAAFDRRGHGRLVFVRTRTARGRRGNAVEIASAAFAIALAESAFSRLAEETARWIAAKGSRGQTCLLVSRVPAVPDEKFVPWLASRVVTGRGVVSHSRSLTVWTPALAPEVFGFLP